MSTLTMLLTAFALLAFASANASAEEESRKTYQLSVWYMYGTLLAFLLNIAALAVWVIQANSSSDYNVMNLLYTYNTVLLLLWMAITASWLRTFDTMSASKSSALWYTKLLKRREKTSQWRSAASIAYRAIAVLSLSGNMHHMATALLVAYTGHHLVRFAFRMANNSIDYLCRFSFTRLYLNMLIISFAISFWLMPPVSLQQWLLVCWSEIVHYSFYIF